MIAKIFDRWRSMFSTLKADETFNLHEVDYTVLDTETTGFTVGKDRILSIGLVRMRAGRILLKDSMEILINSSGNLGSSPAIHGLTQDQLKTGVESETAQELFEQFVQNSVLVAHYAKFDRNMLTEFFASRDQPFTKYTWLDTMDLEVVLHPNKRGISKLLKLDHLLHQYGIEATSRHTALGDAFSTALLLQRQLSELKQAGVYFSTSLPKQRTGLL